MKTLACTLSVGLILLFTSQALPAEVRPVPTSDYSDAAKASISFKQGVQLFREGSFEAALAEFRKAYQISPSYRVLYNIAQAYFELHDYVNAYNTLQKYMADGGNEVSAERRSQVEEMNGKLEERIAFLEITSNLVGADIRIDDISVGRSPLSSTIPVNAGPRRISAVKAGHTDAVHLVTVAGKEHVKVTLDFPEEVPSVLREKQTTTPVIIKNVPVPQESRVGLVASVAVTASCAIATGVFGWLALNAKSDFNKQLDTFPITKDKIDSARSKMKTYAYITDGLGAVTLVSGGLALYFALTGSSNPGKHKVAYSSRSVVLTPTLGGMALHGSW
jgi:tetratricopeptide (TPR) repeat protein